MVAGGAAITSTSTTTTTSIEIRTSETGTSGTETAETETAPPLYPLAAAPAATAAIGRTVRNTAVAPRIAIAALRTVSAVQRAAIRWLTARATPGSRLRAEAAGLAAVPGPVSAIAAQA